jgi:hypothetical protein
MKLTNQSGITNKERAGHKPGSVLSTHSVKRAVIYLGHLLPDPSSGSIYGTGKRPTLVPLPCSQPGFTEPTPLDVAGALLPHLCTLTSWIGKIAMQFTHLTLAVCFCGTILTVTRTGRYPASLVFGEPGLSSVFQFAEILQPPRLLFPNSSVRDEGNWVCGLCVFFVPN